MTVSVTSIQTGSQSISAASGTTINVTISSVTAANAVVWYTLRASNTSSRYYRHIFEALLTSSTNLRLKRLSASSAGTVTLEWVVVEFDGASINLQTGEATPGATDNPYNVTISSVTPGQTVTVFSYQPGSIVGNTLPDQGLGAVYLTSATNLRFGSYRSTGLDWTAAWQVAEFDADVDVQQIAHTFASSDMTDAVSITSVTLAESMVDFCGSTTYGTPTSRVLARGYLSDASTIQMDRKNPGSDGGLATYWQVIDWGGNAVTSGQSTIASGSTSTSPTFTAVGEDSAVASFNGPFENHYLTGDTEAESYVLYSAVLAGTLDGLTLTQAGSAGGYDNNIAWHVVDWTAAGGATVTVAATAANATSAVNAALGTPITVGPTTAAATSAVSVQVGGAVSATVAGTTADASSAVAVAVGTAVTVGPTTADASSAVAVALGTPVTVGQTSADATSAIVVAVGSVVTTTVAASTEPSTAASAAAVGTPATVAATTEDADAAVTAIVGAVTTTVAASTADAQAAILATSGIVVTFPTEAIGGWYGYRAPAMPGAKLYGELQDEDDELVAMVTIYDSQALRVRKRARAVAALLH